MISWKYFLDRLSHPVDPFPVRVAFTTHCGEVKEAVAEATAVPLNSEGPRSSRTPPPLSSGTSTGFLGLASSSAGVVVLYDVRTGSGGIELRLELCWDVFTVRLPVGGSITEYVAAEHLAGSGPSLVPLLGGE